jgi:hypothetical protein
MDLLYRDQKKTTTLGADVPDGHETTRAGSKHAA